MTRISVILLVDPQGRVLLQERDEHAPLSPEKWGMVGGHVDDDEEFEPAAYRELEEETGLRLDGASIDLTGGLDVDHPALVKAVGQGAEALVPVEQRLLRFPIAA